MIKYILRLDVHYKTRYVHHLYGNCNFAWETSNYYNAIKFNSLNSLRKILQTRYKNKGIDHKFKIELYKI